jgi:ATP-binding cassette subfamily C (CFTR/MRP) protein 1
MNAIERTTHYSELPQERWEGTEEPPPSWPRIGQIQFESFELRYRPELEPSLKGISCTIEPGERVGVVGRTGAGKSTLLSSLFRLREASAGEIRIDGISIAALPLEALRSRLTVIPQDPFLFPGTIRQNLDPFGRHDDATLWRIVHRAHLEPTIRRLPHGLDTVVGEGGGNLSGGQRQLLCLARALLRRSQIVLLDEATASIDHETDALIQKTLRDDFRGCTVVTIAHRVPTVIDSSRIVVLDRGRIVEFDTPAALLAKPEGVFKKLAQGG